MSRVQSQQRREHRGTLRNDPLIYLEATMRQRLTPDLSSELINILPVLGLTTISNGEFTVGRGGGTVTVGQIVDDDLDEVFLPLSPSLGAGIGKVDAQIRGFADYVKPDECRDFLHFQGLCLERSVADHGGSIVDLLGIVGAEVNLICVGVKWEYWMHVRRAD